MREIVNNSFYEMKTNFHLIKRESSSQKKMSFSGKYIAKIFSLETFLVGECDFKLICFCESCRGSEIRFTLVYSLKSLLTDWYWYGLSSRFLITMHEIDAAAEVNLEPFQTYMIELFCKNN